MIKLHRFIALTLFLISLNIVAQDDLPLYSLPDSLNFRAFSSGSIVRLLDGNVMTANAFGDSVSIVNPTSREVIAEIPVGADPRNVDIITDGTLGMVTNYDDGTLSILNLIDATVQATYPLGERPYGVVTDNNETAFVTLQGEDVVLEIEVRTGDILKRIPTQAEPTALAIWGDFLYVTHFWTGQISLIYLPAEHVVQTIPTNAQASLSQSIVIDTRNGIAYIPQSISNALAPNRTIDNTIRPVVFVLDLASMTLLTEQTLFLDVIDQPVNMPFAVALDSTQNRLYVANAGSDDVSVIDLQMGVAVWHTEIDSNPRGLVLNRGNTALYVHNVVAGSLSLMETRFFRVEDTLPIATTTLTLDEARGAELFHTADDTRLSLRPSISCASCHFDGQSDRRIWTDTITPTLVNVEMSVSELNEHLRTFQYGTGWEANSADLRALIAYLQTVD